MKVGIHVLSNALYHSGPGLSSSSVKKLIQSPLHYKDSVENREEATTEMIRGTIVHALLLEPEKFNEDFVIVDCARRAGKEYESAVKDNPTKTIIMRTEYQEAVAIQNAFSKQAEENPKLVEYLTGKKELSFYWEDQKTGVTCKCRPDSLAVQGCVVDIKTTRDARLDSFQKSIIDFGYHISAAWYLRGVTEIVSQLGANSQWKIPKEFVFIAIESKAPYAVATYKMSVGSAAIRIANQLIDEALEKYCESVATESWPGYTKETLEIELPNWYLYKMNKR